MTHEIQNELKSTRVPGGTGGNTTGFVQTTRDCVSAADATTGKETEENSDWDFVYYPNPKPSIAQEANLFHVQVFWTADRAIDRKLPGVTPPATTDDQ